MAKGLVDSKPRYEANLDDGVWYCAQHGTYDCQTCTIAALEAENAALRRNHVACELEMADANASLRRVLGELIRLWRWRKEIGKLEDRLAYLRTEVPFREAQAEMDALKKQIAKLLRQYGREKAAAWAEAIKVLEGGT